MDIRRIVPFTLIPDDERMIPIAEFAFGMLTHGTPSMPQLVAKRHVFERRCS